MDIGKRAFFKTENSSLELDAGKAREEEGGGGGGGDKEKEEKEWRGLKLDVLRNRIQRLVVLMNLCEPGTIPDPGMLASLVDLVNMMSNLAYCVIIFILLREMIGSMLCVHPIEEQ